MSDEPQSISRTAGTFAVLPDLTAPGPRDVLKTIDRLGELLAPSQRHATIQLRLLHDAVGDQTSCVRLTLDAGKASPSPEPIDNPDIELITTPEVWWEMATGKLAPHDAFLGGRMRVRGDTRVAQDILKEVTASPKG